MREGGSPLTPTRETALARHVALGTLSFAVCFAAWGLVSAFAVRFRERLHLSATETTLLVAVPVLLGAVARLPMGILTDRFGGRVVFSVLMAIVAVPVYLVPATETYRSLLAAAFFLGLAGSSFAVGVGYVSRWSPPDRQGSILGVYGLGTIGQSAAVFLGPVLASAIGWEGVFHAVAALLVASAIGFALLARDAPARGASRGIAAMTAVLVHERLSWVLAAFYFLTFGGFVAFSIYLPTLLKDDFGLWPADAGFRAAGFVVLATLMRPVGGALSDRVGGARVLNAVFLGIVPFALLLAWPSMIPFTVGALGSAALLGLGNGAVFALVPKYFPAATGTVTGLVGAMGGLGLVIARAFHGVLVAAAILVPLLMFEEVLPASDRAVRAFFAPPADVAPPPPPPPAAAVRPKLRATAPTPRPEPGRFVAPIVVPERIVPDAGIDLGVEGGVPGGVEGGVPGGVVGGVVGGLPREAPPPSPPAVVRVGGNIRAPKLVHDVKPVYPELALQARLSGTVILEAHVGTDGRVQTVRILRGAPVFDDAAIDAVKQWHYQPLLLNGVPTEFILTVTVSFNLVTPTAGRQRQ